jgi:hypothetical protein
VTTLWSTMEPELRDVVQHCVGFGAVTDATSFADYIQRCQIETTMSFNDYWTSPPPLTSLRSRLLGLVAASPFAGAGVAWWLGPAGTMARVGDVLLGAVAGLVAALAVAYRIVMTRGARPFPMAPHSDLPSVLKALYLQQHFTRLAIDAQGKGDQEIYDLFASFAVTHQPAAPTPTQAPGVIHA